MAADSAEDTTQRHPRNHPEDMAVRRWVPATFVVVVSVVALVIEEVASEEAEVVEVSVAALIELEAAEGQAWDILMARLRVHAVGMEAASVDVVAMIAGLVEAGVDATTPTSSLYHLEVAVAATGTETAMEVEAEGTHTTLARKGRTMAVDMTTRGSEGDTRVKCMICVTKGKR